MSIEREIGKGLSVIDNIVSDITRRSMSQGSVKNFEIFLTTPIDDGVYIYNSILAKSRIGVKRHIRPTISISKENKFKGNGTLNDPFILED